MADPERAARWRWHLERAIKGARRQRARIAERTEAAPVTAGNVTDLRGDDTDLDYYVFDMYRIREIARMISETRNFPDRETVAAALDAFDRSVPHLKSLRDPLVHPDGKADSLRDVWWFAMVVRLEPHGAVTYLVDPRYHHEALEQLYDSLAGYLSTLAEPAP